ncbi:hypothetical protein NDU88_005313 [Pleurodeles waltl]|uniref:Uncharacterized protein n=1 Tax=Pleurodeles waltl TaxID=8319 RepID=A0AAV7PHR4_PLEWA|nr:hypothetical protein NDU88_005313 [Pleurodeles waltl]
MKGRHRTSKTATERAARRKIARNHLTSQKSGSRTQTEVPKKGDKRDAGDITEAGTPGPSKKVKANNGEQISMIVQECLKSMAPLLFAKSGGARENKGPGDTESREDTAPSGFQGKGSQATREEATHEQSPSPDGGEEASTTSTAALPTQVWGEGPDKNA